MHVSEEKYKRQRFFKSKTWLTIQGKLISFLIIVINVCRCSNSGVCSDRQTIRWYYPQMILEINLRLWRVDRLIPFQRIIIFACLLLSTVFKNDSIRICLATVRPKFSILLACMLVCPTQWQGWTRSALFRGCLLCRPPIRDRHCAPSCLSSSVFSIIYIVFGAVKQLWRTARNEIPVPR